MPEKFYEKLRKQFQNTQSAFRVRKTLQKFGCTVLRQKRALFLDLTPSPQQNALWFDYIVKTLDTAQIFRISTSKIRKVLKIIGGYILRKPNFGPKNFFNRQKIVQKMKNGVPFGIFRSRKKLSTNYAIVSFFCFFFSRPFHENFKFLRNCPYNFRKILHSHSTPKGAPACSKASKSYDWNVRNIAKISPKMAKISPKTAFFDFFQFSQKLSVRFERNFLQSFYTILESYMCNGIKIVWLGCEKHSQN